MEDSRTSHLDSKFNDKDNLNAYDLDVEAYVEGHDLDMEDAAYAHELNFQRQGLHGGKEEAGAMYSASLIPEDRSRCMWTALVVNTD